MRRTLDILAGVAGLILALGAPARADQPESWNWRLSPENYKKMNLHERALYDKAADLLQAGSTKAAASEFEKHKVQFPDSAVLPYMVLMHGWALHQSHNRLAAIKVYNEIMDYFADKVDVAAPALYWTGVAHMENGDTLKGMKALKEMVEDKDYQKHPLAAGALRRLGENCWLNKDYASAAKYWKQTVRDFGASNGEQATKARRSLDTYFILTRDYAGMDAWMNAEKGWDDPKTRSGLLTETQDVAFWGFARDWADAYTDKDPAKNTARRTEDMKAYYAWYKVQKGWYDKAKDPWSWFERGLQYLCGIWGEKEERRRVADEAVAFVKALPAPADRDDKYSFLCDRLRDARDYERAVIVASFISDPLLASYKQYEFLAHQGKWAEAIARLQQIEGSGNAAWKVRAMNERARAYREHTGEYEKAVNLYREINDPPRTLWDIADCYKRWQKEKEALTTYTEIENAFPAEAPRAAWEKTRYLDERKNRDATIASARRLMKMYPKSAESSNAHQMLEKYGVNPGGGVSDSE